MKKKRKQKNIINKSSSSDNDIRSFIIITAIIVLSLGIVYLVTELTKKNKNDDANSKESVKINYDVLSIGTLLEAPYDDYYVLIYDLNDNNAILYATMLSNYKNTSDSKKIYFIDLGSKLNSPYYNVNNDNKSNTNPKKISDLDLGDLTLIEVKKGNINNYYENYETIKEILS